MRMISIFALLGLGLLEACQKRGEEPAARGQTIVVDNRQISSIDSIDQLIDTLDLVPLESTSASLFADWADGLITGDDRLYVWNHSSNSIAIFNLNSGQFIRKLVASGEGPGEFNSIRAVTFNAFTKELEVFADFKRKELFFDKNGKFLREIPHQLLYDAKAYLTQDIYALYSNSENSEYLGNKESYKILIHDKKKGKWSFFLPVSAKEASLGDFFTAYNFFRIDNRLGFFEPINDKIMEVSAGSTQVRYDIKFSQNPMPDDFWEKNTKKYVLKNEAIADHNFPYVLRAFFENSRFIVFPYEYDKILRVFGYDKKRKKGVFNTNHAVIYKWRLPLSIPRNICPEGLLYLIPAQEFLELLKNDPERKYLPPAFFSIAKTLKPDDNPILMKVVLKNK